MPRSSHILDGALRVLRQVARRAVDAKEPRDQKPAPHHPKRQATPPARGRRSSPTYPGDFRGRPTVEYLPRDDDRADPGEIVWTWVPFEEDHAQGKDRPVLLIGRDGDWLLGLQVTSQDHDRDAAQEARAGRYWTDIGTGAWDARRRPSEVRVNRIIRVDGGAVRRVGAMLDEATFRRVADEVLRHAR